MKKILPPKGSKHLKPQHFKRLWVQISVLLVLMMIGAVAYNFAAEAAPIGECNLMEHQHTIECYEKIADEAQIIPICNIDIHEHSGECYDEEKNLICEQADYLVHQHDDNCYDNDGGLWCTLPEQEREGDFAKAHQHSSECFEIVSAEEELTCTDPDEEHEHTPLCYGNWQLICETPEHTHDEMCQSKAESIEEEEKATPQEENTAYQEIIALIDALPEYEEIAEAFNLYEESDNYDGYVEYYQKLCFSVRTAFEKYTALAKEEQEMITNRDKLLDLQDLFLSDTLAIIDTIDITAVNAFSWDAGAIIVQNSRGLTIGECNIGHAEFKYWYAITVAMENGRYTVKEIYADNGSSKADVQVPRNGFILLYHTGNLGAEVNVKIGDTAQVSSDFWHEAHQYNGEIYGTVRFQSAAHAKNEKDNSAKLHIMPAASTRDFIEVNLYDYGSGSAGRNINDKYHADKNMPGFQQNGGTKNIPSLDSFRSTGYMNFGDVITADLADGTLVTLNSANPQGINVVTDFANSPISRISETMAKELQDGFPALVDGRSLGYLFGAESYAKKMNRQSIDGLFQYDEKTGAYFFNSRENFAQFNNGDDTFTLYREIFTPNFIMYPFGNFMPFNDIVSDAKQVSEINAAYFDELSQQAEYLYQSGAGDEYANLSKVLGQFLNYAKEDGWGDDWNAERALEHYFYWGHNKTGDLPPAEDEENSYRQIALDNLYSLDYDVPSDFFFGMEMKMNFMQPKDGLTGSDGAQPMVFYFTGDDDVWIYIDGKLFLDLSGIHRHVGGEIDFVNGKVNYYSLNTQTGDVETTPYKSISFADILGDSADLNEKGTFSDYSLHSLNFYYMERGSGSSVCRMNFNFPLLRQNSISVTKELTIDGNEDIVGNPDFRFQILKENGRDLFIPAGTNYDILNKSGNLIATKQTDKNGIFTLKAGQTAVFSEINENAGKYFVREILDADTFAQYGMVTVDGQSTTTATASDIVINEEMFKGINSPLKNVSDGSTSFQFKNNVILNKTGALAIRKTLESYPKNRAAAQFDLEIYLDDEPLPVGTVYTVNKQARRVEREGIITIRADETAYLANILAGTHFRIEEMAASALGYSVSYLVDGILAAEDRAIGVIKAESEVAITVNNAETGASINIPVLKILQNPDGSEHEYRLRLTQIKAQDDLEPVESEFMRELSVKITSEDVLEQFIIDYPRVNFESLPQNFYYKIEEVTDENETATIYDDTVYVVQITLSEETGKLKAQISKAWCDDKEIAIDDDFTLSFTNKIKRYELPQTGGRGIEIYLAGGVVFMSMAVIILSAEIKRRKGGAEKV